MEKMHMKKAANHPRVPWVALDAARLFLDNYKLRLATQ